MAEEICFTGKVNVLDEIIENMVTLPIESQNQILMMAKAMLYTRKCIREKETEEYSLMSQMNGEER